MSERTIWTKAFWMAAAERALSTGAQAALLAAGGGALPAVSLPWWTVPAAFGGGVVLGLLKALVVNEVTENGPGLTQAESVNDDAY
jgi:hypothetical protein